MGRSLRNSSSGARKNAGCAAHRTYHQRPGLREAVLRAYRALKACAKVNKDQSRAIKQGTLAEFERAFKSVQTEAERSDYQTCSAKCKTDGATFEKDCSSARKKLCDCKLTEFGCLVTQCLFG